MRLIHHKILHLPFCLLIQKVNLSKAFKIICSSSNPLKIPVYSSPFAKINTISLPSLSFSISSASRRYACFVFFSFYKYLVINYLKNKRTANTRYK